MDLSKFAVINASNPVHIDRESDINVDYRGGFSTYFEGNKMVKKSVSWHSLPASFETEFFVYGKQGWQGILQYDHILVMIKDDLAEVVPLIQKLKTMKKTIGIGFHENGNYFSMKAQDLNWLANFKYLVDMGNYYWNLNISLEDFFKQLFKVPVFSCWHGFPYEWNHGFTVEPDKREGIIIGTRTLTQSLKRNTLFSIGIASRAANKLGTFVTYFSEDSISPKSLEDLFKELSMNVNVLKGPVSYEEWLKLIAKHKVLFHLDASDTLGQVVGDAALVDVPSVGSNTENNNLMGTDCSIFDSQYRLMQEYNNFPINIDKEFKEMTSLKGLKEEHINHLFPLIKC